MRKKLALRQIFLLALFGRLFVMPLPPVVALPALSASQAAATHSQPPAGKEYKFVASSDSIRLEKELNEDAKEGFRLEFLSDTIMDASVGALLSRTSAPSHGNAQPGQPHLEYKVIGARQTSTIGQELEDAAAQGWELRGLTANSSLMPFTISETIAVLEREPGQTKQKYEYRFLTAKREGTLQKELNASVSEGFHPVAMSVNRDNNAVSFMFALPLLRYDLILRRSVENPAAEKGKREYRFVSTVKTSTMEKEMNRLAAKGYRCYLTVVGAVALMAREISDKPVQRYEYQLLMARSGTLTKEVSEAGHKGYAFKGSSGLIVIMEMDHSGQANPARDYKLLGAMRVKTTRKELDDALAEGYEPIRLASLGEFFIVLDRAQMKN
jgi:hypothetical protein